MSRVYCLIIVCACDGVWRIIDLQEYLSSNAFLSSLLETVPHYIKSKLSKFFKELLKIGFDDIDTIKG